MVPFGFSVGDFIAGINLLIDAVHSLSDTNGAQADYEDLGRQLKNLRKGFECIQGLNLDSTHSALASAVDSALNDCRLCVDRFVKRNSKFKSLEAASGLQWSLAALKRQGRKVQWALWKKADVAKFRAAIQQHSDALQILLASIQIKQIETQGKLLASAEQENAKHKSLTQIFYSEVSGLNIQQQGLETMLEDGKLSLLQAMETRFNGIQDEVQICKRNRESALVAQDATTMQVLTEVESINLQIGALKGLEKSMVGDASVLEEHLLTIIENQQQMMAQLRNMSIMARVNQEVPAQVLLSKPVVLLDARGRYAPFHLEFIESAEAFIAVLKIRFKDIGLHKIVSGEFALEDSRIKRSLQLTKPWATIFRPGQQINMSMVYRVEGAPTSRCPGCGKENAGSDLEDTECGNSLCETSYRIIVEVHAASSNHSNNSRKSESRHVESDSEAQLKRPSLPEGSIYDEMQHYTRLHILTEVVEDPYLNRASPHNSSDSDYATRLSSLVISPSQPSYPIHSYPAQSSSAQVYASNSQPIQQRANYLYGNQRHPEIELVRIVAIPSKHKERKLG